jgi:hypothetical protein
MVSHSTVTSHQHPRVLDIFDNAKFEQIACGIKPLYDGSPNDLVPTLNSVHIRRQDKVWYSASFIIQDAEELGLIGHFSEAKHGITLKQAQL